MELCGDDDMASLVKSLQNEGTNDLAQVDEALARYPDDPRLHFMRGSIQAARQQPIEAHSALARAVQLAPDFHIARYQLGFFELTSGEIDRALSTWAPLLRLPADFYLRKFVEGLIHLVRDEFDDALAAMREGISLNTENEPLNNDIRLLMRECEQLPHDGGEGGEPNDRSATSFFLGQFGHKSTQH